MKRINACMAIIIATSVLSCNKESNSNTERSIGVHDMALSISKDKAEESLRTSDTSLTKFTPPQILPNAGTPFSDWEKKIIKTADVRLELKDYVSYNTSIHNNLKNFGAYIASEEQTQNEGEIINSISIKVPVDKFEDLMNTFSGDGIKVIQRRINTTDVTNEVVDTKGRIQAKKQAREKYLELLSKAKNMKEILEVQNEINGLQEELESGAGRVNFLTHQASYSTINLTYFQYNSTYNETSGFLIKLKEAFKNGVDIVSTFLLFIVTVWPLLLIALSAWLFARKWKLISLKSAKKA